MEAYIGLLISMGALQASAEPIDMLWTSDGAYCSVFPATVSRDRFKLITSFMRFDNFQTREIRKQKDKLRLSGMCLTPL